MATRFLVLILFILAVIASSALTVIYLDKNSTKTKAGVDLDTVEKVVADFIEENPEVIVDALREAQAKQARQEAEEAERNVAEVRDQLEDRDPISGDDSDEIAMVVFHDYNCGFCRKVIPDVEKLVKDNDDLRVILVDMPILGPQSVAKAKASLAVAEIAPEKHYDFYIQLSEKNPRTEEQIIELASSLGIDSNSLSQAMKDDALENTIRENKAIAQRIGIRGTPAFIIDGKLIKGAVGVQRFQSAIDEARNS
jgi:protein-disulfide isomerase